MKPLLRDRRHNWLVRLLVVVPVVLAAEGRMTGSVLVGLTIALGG